MKDTSEFVLDTKEIAQVGNWKNIIFQRKPKSKPALGLKTGDCLVM
jgi:hypothetical protein